MANGSSAALLWRRSWAIFSSRRLSILRCEMEHPLIFSICAFLMLMIAVTGVGYRFFYKPGKFMRQLGNPVITAAQRVIEAEAEPTASTIVTFLHQIGSRVPSSDAEVATLKADLMRAGIRSESALPVFYGIRIIATLALLMISVMLEPKMPDNPVMRV